jgi:hypothetical protein
MTNGCRVLLLRLADGMDAKGIVSIPRSTLAREFGVAPARITENVKLARQLGFLDMVRRARPGVTAVYQATNPDLRRGTPQRTSSRGTENSTYQGTAGRTPKQALEVRPDPHPSSNGKRDRSDSPTGEHATTDGIEKEIAATATAVPPKAEHASNSPSKSNARPWADLQRAIDAEETDGLDKLGELLGGWHDDAEERTAAGMVANGSHIKTVYNKIRKDRSTTP